MLAKNQKTMLLNTGMLYIRMFFIMGVTLYTSRLALSILGVEDFGTYHVVAGFVIILGFLHGAMTSATQRYFSFELGKKDASQLSAVFSTSLIIHVLIVAIIILLAETLGYWFVSNKLTLPPGKFEAAMMAYHFSVVTFAFTVLVVPFTALIMSYERMGIFAVISIIDVVLKLVAVLILQFLAVDKLAGYASLLALVSLITWMVYVIYCQKAFSEVRYQLLWNKELFTGMLSYTAWNTWGNLASVASGQGSNILLNMFFGPSVNAARAVAYQANTALVSFIQSVQSAINPQIIKLYAAKDYKQMHALVLAGAKYNFLLLFVLSMPVIFTLDALLSIWLVEVPLYSVGFIQLLLVSSLINAVSLPLMTAAQATGHIRLYQSVVGGVLLLNLPVSYIFLQNGGDPYVVFFVNIFISLIALVFRLLIIMSLINLSATHFIKEVILRSVLVAVAVIAPLITLNFYIASWHFINVAILTLMLSLFSIWLFGLNKNERSFIIEAFKKLFNRGGFYD